MSGKFAAFLLGAALVTALHVVVTCAISVQAQGPSAPHSCCVTPEQMRILQAASYVEIDNGLGNLIPTVRFTGVNVQIVSGLGATNGNPDDPISIDPNITSTNGSGNLVIGYNETGNLRGDDRSGSHNLIIGAQNNATSFGATTIGFRNDSAAPYACASAGTDNVASGPYSTISGGKSGTASGTFSTISGGNGGTASGQSASIVGGQLNRATGLRSCVLGGGSNHAAGEECVVVGGGHAFDQSQGNVAGFIRSVVVGGRANTTSGHTSVISGGLGRTTSGDVDWVAGGLFEDQ